MIFNDSQSPASSHLSFEDNFYTNEHDAFATSLFSDNQQLLTLDTLFDDGKQMSAAAFADQLAFLPDSLAAGGFGNLGDDIYFDYNQPGQQFSQEHLSPMAFPQRQLQAHRRRLSQSSTMSQSSASPYSHPASLQYSGHGEQYMEPNYPSTSWQQQQQQQQHNLPTPSQTPTSDTVSEKYRRRSQVPMQAKMALAHNQPRSVSQQRQGGDYAYPPQQDLPNTPRTFGGGDDEDAVYPSSGENESFLEDLLDCLPCLPDDPVANNNNNTRPLPSLDRTISLAYNDELYNPPPPQQQQRQQQQQQQQQHDPRRFNTMQGYQQWAPSASRDNSPYRQPNVAWPSSHHGGFADGQINTASRMRQQQKAEADALAYQQHMAQANQPTSTVSPKDTVNHDYQPAEEPAPPSLFPETSIPESTTGGQDASYGQGRGDFYRLQQRQGTQVPTSNFTFVPSGPSSGTHFPSGGNAPPQFRYQGSSSGQMPDFAPPPLVSMETSASEDNAVDDAPVIERPKSTAADSGTYTCTYNHCTQRFESPMKLQKHKREDHRSAHHSHMAHAHSQQQHLSEPQTLQQSSSATPELADRNSQAGPHKCERINPTTGKPCNTIFSRPYDLTRHEDTIHNAKKKKVRCPHCTEDKTFSRADALSRHMRVVHPEIDFPGKHGRRRAD